MHDSQESRGSRREPEPNEQLVPGRARRVSARSVKMAASRHARSPRMHRGTNPSGMHIGKAGRAGALQFVRGTAVPVAGGVARMELGAVFSLLVYFLSLLDSTLTTFPMKHTPLACLAIQPLGLG